VELKWEKGGSGLVFYTDDLFWRKTMGEDKDRENDLWDVDVHKVCAMQ
jgi:hypothetical protein